MNSKDSGLPSTPGEVDLEDIAALADGRLEGAERQRVIERLAEDEASYEIFQEVLRFQEEEEQGAETPKVEAVEDWAAAVEKEVEEEKEPDVVVPIDRGRRGSRWRQWMPIVGVAAAAMLAVVVAGSSWRSELTAGFSGAGRYASERLVGGLNTAKLAPRLDRDWYTAVRRVHRGPVEISESERIEFQLGVEIIGLEIAVRTQDLEMAEPIAQRLVVLLENHDFAALLDFDARELEQKLDRVGFGVDFEKDVLALEGELGKNLGGFYFDYGRWLEAGRLAATEGNPKYFASRGTRTMLESLEEEGLSEDAVVLRALIDERKDYDFAAINALLVEIARRRGAAL